MPNQHPSILSSSTTSARIKKLSPLLINQLAAGEVVTRPAAVVKELLENAIDAEATSIDIHITQGGMGMIEVVDNGMGIHPDDMVMAITRHATSKVADIAHLQGISTLGFRGEALAATAAVSRLSLSSSHDDSGVGRQLQVAGVLAETPTLTPVVHHRGTTVTVKDLYFNVPARRGNLKSVATEFNHIESIIRDVALARADITLNLFHDHKKRLSLVALDASTLPATGNASDQAAVPLSRLEQALGMALTGDALALSVDLSSLLQQSSVSPDAHQDSHAHTHFFNHQSATIQSATINGWLWAHDEAQSSAPKLLYINGRLIKEALISNQLRQLASSAELSGMGYALYFQLPQHWLNINVHPSKQRIKISPLNNIMAHLSHAVRLKLNSISKKMIQPFNTANTAQQAASLATSLPQSYLGSNDTRQSERVIKPQVQTPTQAYQLSTPSISVPSASPPATSAPTEYAAGAGKSLSRNTQLPQCMGVISYYPKSYAAINSAGTDDFSALPWLLFHSQGQYLLISMQDWQQHIAALINQDRLTIEADADTVVADTELIQQQLNTHIASLSSHEAHVFSFGFAQTLSEHAFSVISTEQLVAFMLSSAPS